MKSIVVSPEIDFRFQSFESFWTQARTFSVQSVRVVFRVTGLGEFSPILSLFTWGNCLEITEVAYIFGLPSSTVEVMHYIIH
jgi:hypothetical protein